MKYCQNTTIGHPLSKRFPHFVNEINKIIEEESKDIQPQPFANEVGLKLDIVKNNSENLDIKRMKSMDMVLGMKDPNNSKTYLLIDFKLDCKNVNNISESECRDKIKHSKILLFGAGLPIHNEYIFIFNDNILQVAKRVISQKLANASGQVLGIDDLKSKYF